MSCSPSPTAVAAHHRTQTAAKSLLFLLFSFPRQRVNDNDNEQGGFHGDDTRPFIRNQRNKEKNEIPTVFLSHR